MDKLAKIVYELQLPIRLKKESLLYFKQINKIPLDSNILIYGKSGTGKTIQAINILINHALDNYPDNDILEYSFFSSFQYGYLNISEFLYNLRKSITSYLIDDYIQKYLNIDYIILDDIGVEKSTEWVHEILYLIINHRYNNYKKMIITSNLPPSDLSKKINDDRLMSRILTDTKIINKTHNYRNNNG